MSDLLQKIKSRGYWKVVIRPSDFVKYRVEGLGTLKKLVTDNSVSLRGWDFPHVTSLAEIKAGMDWIEDEIDWSIHIETWRFYQSGQFVFFGCIWQDWLEQAHFKGWYDREFKPGEYISVEDTVFRFTEILEFAARLAMTDVGSDHMIISSSVYGLTGRALLIDSVTRAGFSYPRVCHITSFPHQVSVTKQVLLSEAKELALQASRELFARFNWDADIEILRAMQDELKK